jgi:hypothetical protein
VIVTGAGAASGTGVTLITDVLLAAAAAVSAATPIFLARRRAAKERAAAAAKNAAATGELAIAGWSTLNAALQQEINRLQYLAERLRTRVDTLEAEREETVTRWRARAERLEDEVIDLHALVLKLRNGRGA